MTNNQFWHIHPSVDELALAAAEWITADIEKVTKSADRYTIALSGGSTPKKLHAVLAEEPYKSRIPWEKLHFFWGDERNVPFNDERNNAKMAFDTLLNKVPVVGSQIHIMDTSLDSSLAAQSYEKITSEYFGDTGFSFDLVLLGMGDDGHTLSLFPGTSAVHEKEKNVFSFFLEAQGMDRITLSAPLVNRAHKIAFLITGENKQDALYEVTKGRHNPDQYPAQLIQPNQGELHWFVDAPAAAKI